MHKSTVKENIEKLLAVAPNLRDDDNALFVAYYSVYHNMDVETLQELFADNVPSTTTIRRTRQFIQEQGKFLPADAGSRIYKGRILRPPFKLAQ